MEKFMAFKFPARRHFGFYDVLRLPLLFGSFQTIKSKIAARWKFKSHKLFHLLLLLNVISPLYCKPCPKSGGFL